jgi:serine protease Do
MEIVPMKPSESASKGRLSARRIVLLATTIAGLGAAAFVATPDLNAVYPTAHAQNLSEQAQKLPAPQGFADIVAKVKPAVISVRVKIEGDKTAGVSGRDQIPPDLRDFFRRFGMPGMPDDMPGSRGRGPGGGRGGIVMGQGSGFFISPDGYAVTNNHVVENAESVEVATDNGKTYKAKVIGTDPRTDLALIKIEGGSSFPYVQFADGQPRIGDWVLAIGNPFGLSSTVTAGIISARGRDINSSPYDDFLQIDAPVNKGNSGGPAFDVEGHVVGVNTAIYSPSGGSVGIAFAIPADTVKSVVAQLKEHGSVTRGWLGVQIQTVTPEIADSLGLKKAEGALVAEPQPNSPAAKAGIKAGEVITQVNGDAIKDSRELAKKIGAMQPGAKVNLTVLQNGQEKTVTVDLGTMPNKQEARATPDHDSDNGPTSVDMGKLGLTLAPANKVEGSGGKGVVVTGVDSSGVAAEHGFSQGDVIVSVNGKDVSSPADVRQEIGRARKEGRKNVLMHVKSGDNMRFVPLPVAQG